MSDNSKSPTAELTCDKMCVQLIKHRAALGRAMRVCNDAIADIGTGKDDPIKAAQKAIEATEGLWHHTELSMPEINNGVLMKCCFDLLAERK